MTAAVEENWVAAFETSTVILSVIPNVKSLFLIDKSSIAKKDYDVQELGYRLENNFSYF